jgi:hypothetical protein
MDATGIAQIQVLARISSTARDQEIRRCSGPEIAGSYLLFARMEKTALGREYI